MKDKFYKWFYKWKVLVALTVLPLAMLTVVLADNPWKACGVAALLLVSIWWVGCKSIDHHYGP